MTQKNKTNYEAPATEVVTVRIERTILSGVQSSRANYGKANDGITENGADWEWN
jgi:hypothetical protein